jgi:glycine/D-amino acid oxidase-like deaminating enzyme
VDQRAAHYHASMPAIDIVTPNESFPDKADAVIIGAGIIGIMTALELSERGHFVVVVEKGEVAAEQSSRNWGWCRQMGRDPREVPLIQVALEKWRGMNARIGADTGFRQCGILYMSETDVQFADREKWYHSVAKPRALNTRLIGAKEVAQLAPGSLRAWRGGLFSADDGRAEPFVAVPAMARALQARGGMVFTTCAARGIETSAGRVSALVTEKGTIKTDTVIVAGGYWTRRFLGNAGIKFPQLGVVNSVMRTSAREVGFKHTVSGSKYAVRRRLDGGYTITHNHLSVAELTPGHLRQFFTFRPLMKLDRKGIRVKLGTRFLRETIMRKRWQLDEVSPFERVRILDPKPYKGILDEALLALQQDFPAFQGIAVEERWAGMIDATPDAVPIMDSIAKIPGLFVASGFSGHGFGMGPGAGQLMAEIITGEKTCVDPAPFKLDRFGWFSRPMPTTGL